MKKFKKVISIIIVTVVLLSIFAYEVWIIVIKPTIFAYNSGGIFDVLLINFVISNIAAVLWLIAKAFNWAVKTAFYD